MTCLKSNETFPSLQYVISVGKSRKEENNLLIYPLNFMFVPYTHNILKKK